MWDSGVVLGKFLEHAVDSGALVLQGKKVVELGSGCGLVGYNCLFLIMTSIPCLNWIRKKQIFNLTTFRCKGFGFASYLLYFALLFHCSCIAALLGAQVFLTDLPDRLRLLKKNVEANIGHGNDIRGSAEVRELTWGYDPDADLIQPLPDYGMFMSSILPFFTVQLSFSK